MKTYKLCGDHDACCPVVNVASNVRIQDDYKGKVSLDKELVNKIINL